MQPLTKHQYVFILPDKDSALNDVTAGYTIPLTLCRVMKVAEDGESAFVHYQWGTSYTGKFKNWLTGGSHGPIQYSGTIERSSVVVCNVSYMLYNCLS